MNDKSRRFELTDLRPPEEVGDRLARLAVFAEVEPLQDARRGIAFALEVTNQGEQQVELSNPIDHVQYMITDAAGVPLRNVPSVSRIKIDAVGESVAPLLDRFSAISLRRDGSELNFEDEARRATITLPPASSYTLDLRVSRMAGDEGTLEIPAGSYTITLTCSLVAAAAEGADFRLLQSDAIPVELE